MERPRRFPSRRATIIGLPLLALAIAGGFMQSAPGGVWLAGMVSRAASSPDMALNLGVGRRFAKRLEAAPSGP